MSFDSDLEFVYQTAKSDSADAKICRQVLISLWNDGEPDGCELLKLLTLEQPCFTAVSSVLQYLYSRRIQLDMFMSTKQIASLAAVDRMDDEDIRSKHNAYSQWH